MHIVATLLATALAPSQHATSWQTGDTVAMAGYRRGRIYARISVRELEPSATPDRSVSLLTAESICAPEDASQLAVLASALQQDLNQRFTRRNSAEHLLLLAEDDASDELVGCCGVDVQRLSPAGEGADRLGRGDARLRETPLLSSLAVNRAYRKRGIAKRLCREAERAARGWGYNQVLLKVEDDNRRARSLYRKLGYRVVATDTLAERPVAGPGGLKFVSTTQVVMRKDLRFPPTDVIASAIVVSVLASRIGMAIGSEQLADAEAMLAAGQLAELGQLLLGVLQQALALSLN